MLRRLEKRILVDLPIADARKAMLKQYLPPVLAANDENGIDIKTEIDYDSLAEVSTTLTVRLCKAWFERATQLQIQAACVSVLPDSHVKNASSNANASK